MNQRIQSHDIAFLDTETLGLDPDAPVWEVAIIRRYAASGREDAVEFTIQHKAGAWLDDFPDRFANDYHARFDPAEAVPEFTAARVIHQWTKGAHIVGAVPSFDAERLAKLLRRHGIEPEWHYHLIDVENVIVGALVAAQHIYRHLTGIEAVLTGQPPYNSNELSNYVGINPELYARHTAMGDVLWVRDQWDAVMTNGGNGVEQAAS